VNTFENYLSVLQSYLRGEQVPFEALEFSEQIAPDVATLGLADTPDASAIKWLNAKDIKVPVEVAATGPRVIETAAAHADRVMLALGADTQRLGWGIETAQQAAKKAGRSIQLGAYINMVCHPDVSVARALVQGGLSTFARFSVMHGKVRGSISASQESVLNQLHETYDMNEHTRSDSKQANILTDEFIDQYAIVGPPEHCLSRLHELKSLGIDKVTIIGPSAGSDKNAAREAEELLAREILAAI
jgi:5,10-methylenetetrahydromethanopterin reductase